MAKHLGEILHTIRKTARISQVELGKKMSVHQTAICRIEQGTQELSSNQLTFLASFYQLSLDGIMSGEIDYWSLAERFGQTPAFPDRYRELPFSKVRETLPILQLLGSHPGEGFLDQTLKKMGINPLFLKNPDQTIGAEVGMDLLRTGITSGKLNRQNVKSLTREALAPAAQGFLHQVYRSQSDSVSLVMSRVLNSTHYESNFQYEIEDMKPGALTLSISPAEHMRDVGYRDETLGDVLCVFKKDYFSQLPRYIGRPALKLTESACHFHGDKKCVYLLKTA